jgi:hypothetical protein
LTKEGENSESGDVLLSGSALILALGCRIEVISPEPEEDGMDTSTSSDEPVSKDTASTREGDETASDDSVSDSTADNETGTGEVWSTAERDTAVDKIPTPR